MNDHLPEKELSIQFTERAFRKLLSIYVFNYFPFGFEGSIWDLIVSVPDHCFSFHSSRQSLEISYLANIGIILCRQRTADAQADLRLCCSRMA